MSLVQTYAVAQGAPRVYLGSAKACTREGCPARWPPSFLYKDVAVFSNLLNRTEFQNNRCMI